MLRQKLALSAFIISCNLLNACAQKESAVDQPEVTAAETQDEQKEKPSIHKYGGWYCPDNLSGFPPVNATELATVPIVNGRMATQEEARNGTSLMYFDPKEFPTAKPVDMDFPRLAYYYSNYTKQNAVVIVIQAITVDKDTVAGFRYLNGGNGSSWLRELDFLTDAEIAELGPTPFVFLEMDINASKEKIWEAVTKTDYAEELGERFHEQAFFDSEWTNEGVGLSYLFPDKKAVGNVSLHFGNIYLQINSEDKGSLSIEKMLIGDNEDGKSGHIQVVFGPFPKDYKTKKSEWVKWLKEVKKLSEAE